MNDVRNDINFRYSHWRKLHSSFRRACFEILGLKKCPPDPSSLAYKHPELRSLVPQSPVYLHDFSFVRCGLSGKNKLSYEKFLGAFQDQRLTGYGRVTLDTPGKVFTPVLFERHDSLSPEAAINRLRNKIGENPETIQRVSPILPPPCEVHFCHFQMLTVFRIHSMLWSLGLRRVWSRRSGTGY